MSFFTEDTGRHCPSDMVAWYTRDGWQLITHEEHKARVAVINADWRATAAKAWEQWLATHYPTRWPAAHRPTMDRLRAMSVDDPTFSWVWYRDKGDGVDRPKGSIVFDFVDGSSQMFESPAALTAHFNLGATPKAKSTKTSKAEVVQLAHRLLAVARHHDAELAAHAEILLAAA